MIVDDQTRREVETLRRTDRLGLMYHAFQRPDVQSLLTGDEAHDFETAQGEVVMPLAEGAPWHEVVLLVQGRAFRNARSLGMSPRKAHAAARRAANRAAQDLCNANAERVEQVRREEHWLAGERMMMFQATLEFCDEPGALH